MTFQGYDVGSEVWKLSVPCIFISKLAAYQPNKFTFLINMILKEHLQHVSVQVINFRFLKTGILFSLAVYLVHERNIAFWPQGFN